MLLSWVFNNNGFWPITIDKEYTIDMGDFRFEIFWKTWLFSEITSLQLLNITTKGGLVKHKMAVHEGVKNSCGQCNYQATRKESLAEHKRSIVY